MNPALNPAEIAGGKLTFSQHVIAPEHNYLQDAYNPLLAVAFNGFSASCMDYYRHASETNPQAVMHVEPKPVDIKPGTISFMVAWGRKTELPHPRAHKIPEYFGKKVIKYALARSKTQETELLDAKGFVGRARLVDGIPEVTVAVGQVGVSSLLTRSYSIATPALAEMSVVEIDSDVKACRPLRFHEGIKWHPNNGYIGVEYYPDDELRALRQI